jgi:carbon starvation protein
MLMESFVAIMAMVAASVIEPVYFAMNSPAAVVGADVVRWRKPSAAGAS